MKHITPRRYLRRNLAFGNTFAPAIVSLLFLSICITTAGGQTAPCITGTQLIVDGGFETGGIPNSNWAPETSTNFGTPLCDVPSCGTGGGASPPRTGAFWAWFGGIPAPETATLGQTVTTAVPTVARLRYYLRVGTVSTPFTDVLNVRVNGTIVQTVTEPAVAQGAYVLQEVTLSQFAVSGGSYAILFEYIGPTTGTGSYVIDDVTLNVCAPSAAGVSISGRVLGVGGLSKSTAFVTLTDTSGTSKTVPTNPFGYYRFDDVEVGRSYTVSVESKSAIYTPRLVTVSDELAGLDFTPIQ